MTTNPEEPLEAETPAVRAEHIARTVIAGHPQGAVRRIVLYLIAYTALLVAVFASGAVALTAGAIGFAAYTLLISTDQLL